jgi:hypothetical protein
LRRERSKSRRTVDGVAAGSSNQSGVRSISAAIVSGDGGAAERRTTRQHFIEHAAECPDVGAFVDGLAACLLGLMYATVPTIKPSRVSSTVIVGAAVASPA